MESNQQPLRKKRPYEAPCLTRVHLDPVKDLLMSCAGNDPQVCVPGDPNGGLTS